MRCSVCGAEGLCWYNAQREMVCRTCRDKAARDAYRAQVIGQHRVWSRIINLSTTVDVPVTVEDVRGGWLIVRDEAGVSHRVRAHNTKELTQHAAHR